jgi:flagellar motor switch protein FliN/FliY
MNTGASNVIVQGVFKGAFDALGALLNTSFSYDTTDVGDLDLQDLPELLGEYPICMQARVKNNGMLVIAFTYEDARRLTAAVSGEESPAKLDEGALETLKEVAAPFLGGAASNLSEKFARDIELEPTSVSADASEAAQGLRAALGGNVTAARFQFGAPGSFDTSSALLLFSQDLEGWVPQSLIDLVFGEDEPALEGDSGLSASEVSDILRNFDESPAPSRPSASSGQVHANLDMILDIRLRVTARLGRVEMPLHDVLAMGPGSIIEVGHTIDEPVELLVNDKLIARGDVVVVDEKFGLRITEIVSTRERIESLR